MMEHEPSPRQSAGLRWSAPTWSLSLLFASALLLQAGKSPVKHPLPATPVLPPKTNLFEDLIATMDAAVAGKDPVADRRMLSEKDDQTGRYVHNRNHPAFAFHGFTGISVLGNGANCGHNATLVAPRIVVTAGHCWQQLGSPHYYRDGQGKGAEWRFLDRQGKVHHAYAQNSRLLTNTLTGQAVDTRMFILKKAMPPAVEPVLWPSPELASKAGGLSKLPLLVGSGNKRLWPRCLAVTNYAAWYQGVRGGDSGSGCFVAVGTNLVLVSTFGGDLLVEGINWRETAEWLCKEAGAKPSIPKQVDLSGYK